MVMRASLILALTSLLLTDNRSLAAHSEHAENFATTVCDLTLELRGSFVLEVDETRLTCQAIEALYKNANRALPADVSQRLKAASQLNDKARKALLVAGYSALEHVVPLQPRRDRDQVIRTLLRQLDLHSQWLTDEGAFARFGLIGSPVGIGVQLETNPASGMVRVVTPVKDGPAHRAGIRPGDRIQKVILHPRPWTDDSEPPPEEVSTRGLSPEEVRRLLGGNSGQVVRLVIKREGSARGLVFDIARGRSKEEIAIGWQRKEDDSWDYWLDSAHKIAYIRIRSVAWHSSREVVTVIRELHRAGMKGLVLDLRFVTSGVVDSAAKIAELFLPNGFDLVTAVSKQHPIATIATASNNWLPNFPLVCLINGETADIAEVLAACLQDHGRAIIVGQRSKGRGTIRRVVDCGDGQAVFSHAYWQRPSGAKIDVLAVPGRSKDEWGVRPERKHEVILKPAEQRALLADLEQSEILRCDKPLRTKATEDRQLRLALATLQDRLK
jgi:carboxyl-terminal processing protease